VRAGFHENIHVNLENGIRATNTITLGKMGPKRESSVCVCAGVWKEKENFKSIHARMTFKRNTRANFFFFVLSDVIQSEFFIRLQAQCIAIIE
jgi:hypothetical protein